ncbi:unconventional myosin-VIIa-like isoform X2 [Sycon ciliatum]
MQESNVDGVEDMIHLDDVSEAGLLRNIRIRFGKDRIYTYTGTILVALNPNKNLGIYNKEMIHRYAGAKLQDYPPHIFAIANAAYEKMKYTQANQCIINSGETGAGKTESTKLILQFLAAVSGQHNWIEQQILDSNPVLEAFGNAKTSRNDNSSRFGKYINIHFDRLGHIQFAKIHQYLLEKCRIVHQNFSELNYHIYYLMLAGLDEQSKERLHLQDITSYHYLVEGECPPLPQHNADEFRKVKAAMKVLMFTEDEMWTIFSILAALLHIGNIQMTAIELKQLEASELVHSDLTRIATDLLQIDEKEMIRWFTNKSTSTGRGDTVVSPLSKTKAMDMKDSFVKGIYSKMFVWVAGRINSSIEGPKLQRSRSKLHPASSTISIGILDIFGFESSDHGNFFEQLCVNYTNEKLQNFFLHHIFKLEQAEYEAENISWSHIPFVDNQEVLDLLCMKRMNILALVDEESRFPKGSDDSLLQKLTANHGKNALYIKPKPRSNKFGIQHFAGTVSYITEGFLEKNRDTFSKDLIRLLHSSRLSLVHNFFKKDFDEMGFKVPPTLASQFRTSLDEMMEALRGCEPFFVRCIKPNMMMQPTVFDRELVLKQLRYSGMMETVKIRMVGYPVRMAFANFVKRYWMTFNKGSKESAPDDVDKLMMSTIAKKLPVLKDKDWQVGRSKLFLKEEQFEALELLRAQVVTNMATKIQRRILLWLTRIRLKRRRAAAIVFQRAWRTICQRRWFLKVRSGFIKLQARWRCYHQRRRYLKIRAFARGFQPRVRGYLVRKRVRRMVTSLIKLQSHARRLSARKRVGKIRIDLELSREEERRREQERIEAERAAERARMTKQQRREEEERIRQQKLREEAEERERLAQQEAERRRIDEEAQQVEREKDRKQMEELKNMEEMRAAFAEAQLVQKKDSEEGWESAVQQQRDNVKEKWRAEREKVEEMQVRQRSSSGSRKFSSPVVKIKRVVSGLAMKASPGSSRSRTSSLAKESSFDDSSSRPLALKALLLPQSVNEDQLGEDGEDDDDELASAQKKEFGILPYTAAEVVEKPKLIPPTALSSFGYRKFAAIHYRDETRATFSAQPSAGPLLYHPSVDQRQTASQLRTCIMQFMGDLPETHAATRAQLLEEVGSIMLKLRLHHSRKETMPLPPYPLSQLDKVHFIVGNCILYPTLRDEVYSIMIGQLSGNPTPSSRALGWVLMCLCLGCVAPSNRMINYFRNFVLTGPKSYAPLLDKRLQRTYKNADRQWPPSFLELQAAKIGAAQLPVIVRLADGRCITVMIDPATSAGELCKEVLNGLKLKDRQGYALAVEMGETVINIGAGDYPVMDTVSACEQYTSQLKGCDVTTLAANDKHQQASRQQKQSTSALNACSLVLVRTFFPPWHDCTADRESTDLVYHQVIHGIKTGNHQYQSDEELIVLLAQECFIRYNGDQVNTKKLVEALRDILPEAELERRTDRKWAALVKATQAKGGLDLAGSDLEEIKQDVVDYAKINWILPFSYEYSVEKVTGLKLEEEGGTLSLAVHYQGVSLLHKPAPTACGNPDDRPDVARKQEKNMLLTIPYDQLVNISMTRTVVGGSPTIQLVTLDGDMMYVTAAKAEGVSKLVNELLTDLRHRSHFATVIQTPSKEDESWLAVQIGDVLVLDKCYAELKDTDEEFVTVVNLRTSETGDVPVSCLSILPITREPDQDFKAQLTSLNATAHQHFSAMVVHRSRSQSMQSRARAMSSSTSMRSRKQSTAKHTERESTAATLYTLKLYATRHFVPAGDGVKSIVHPSTWQYSKAELKWPLLFHLRSDPSLSRKALNMFTSILKYCGEYPTQVSHNSTIVVQRVFKSPLEYTSLRDELYCQLFKQLTSNPASESRDRVWQLLWMATGLFACSKEFFEEANLFLKCRAAHSKAALKCLQRLQLATRGSPRQYSPHQTELMAAQEGLAEMNCSVHFPDLSHKKFAVTSRTKVRNLVEEVSQAFSVKRNEFDVVLKQGDEVLVSLPEKQYIFDTLQEYTEQEEDDVEAAETQLVFVRKLWITNVIGVSNQLDHRVNFPQELAKYMQGCHKVSNTVAVYLAIMIWYIRFSQNPKSLDEPGFSSIFHQLVPEDMIRKMSLREWRKSIAEERKKIRPDASTHWAERKFLERLSSAPTFGASFFTMKQSVYTTLPEQVIMAVNKHGVSLLDATSKEILAHWDYSEISNWSFGDEQFLLTIGGMLRSSPGMKLLCDTSEGAMIDSLLTAYSALPVPAAQKQQQDAAQPKSTRPERVSVTSIATSRGQRQRKSSQLRL